MNKPDWDLWAFIPGAKLWQACALSMNIDPDSFDPNENPYPSEQTEIRRLFAKRLRIAAAQMENKKFRFSRRSNDWDRAYEIYLADFAAWAVHEIQWGNLPPEFAAIGQGQPVSTGDHKRTTTAGTVQQQSEKAAPPAPAFRPRVGWQIALFDSWLQICHTYSRIPTAPEAANWLRKNDDSGNILSKAAGSGFWWKPQRGNAKEVPIKTIENVISAWKVKGVLPA